MISEKIKKQVFSLSKKERAQLAHELIDSLQPDKKIKSEKEWSKELKRRISQYERGESSTRSWTDVKENARSMLNT